MKVLVADDDLTTVTILESMLRKDGHETTSVPNGAEALMALMYNEFDIVLLDWMMPDLTGLDVCKKIREMEAHTGKYSYIVFLTARSDLQDFKEAMDTGADDFLVKPVDATILTSRLTVGRRIIGYHKKLVEKNQELKEAGDKLVEYNLMLSKQLDTCKADLARARVPEARLDTANENTLPFGMAHLIQCDENGENTAYHFLKEDVTHGIPGIVLSRTNPEIIKKKYDLVKTDVIWLSKGLGTERTQVPLNFLAFKGGQEKDVDTEMNQNLKNVIMLISEFIDKQGKCVILLDGIEYLFFRFPPQYVMDMLFDLSELVQGTSAKILVSVYTGTLEDKIIAVLKREMNWIPIPQAPK